MIGSLLRLHINSPLDNDFTARKEHILRCSLSPSALLVSSIAAEQWLPLPYSATHLISCNTC